MKKFRKIACIGSHGIGKSTLAFSLAKKCKFEGENVCVIEEVVRHSPFGINSEMTFETCLWTCCQQICWEMEAQKRGFSLIISDRSIYDPLIYSAYNKLTSPFESPLSQMAYQWLKSYDEIFFVRPRPDHQALADGVRSTDKNFIFAIDKLFEEMIALYQLDVKVIYTDEIFNDRSA